MTLSGISVPGEDESSSIEVVWCQRRQADVTRSASWRNDDGRTG